MSSSHPVFNPNSPSELLEFRIFLDALENKYNNPKFIENDPISLPHSVSTLQDKEIMAFFSAIFAIGRRNTSIRKTLLILELMDGEPHSFVLAHSEKELARFLNFTHRYFKDIDILYFICFFKHYYSKNSTLEIAFSQHLTANSKDTQAALKGFYHTFFSLPDVPKHTRKHIASPTSKMASKRLHMLLRWMVRNDGKGVDLGLWKTISPALLICPLDVHSGDVARKLGLLRRKESDLLAALELTANLRLLCPEDPVKYDFALFGSGEDGIL
ncbi:MAG: TIGR02757 family protein [Bacteroidota bacterium]